MPRLFTAIYIDGFNFYHYFTETLTIKSYNAGMSSAIPE